MKRLAQALAAAALLLTSVPASAGGHTKPHAAVQKAGRLDANQLRTDMRKLWEDHVTYTAFFYNAVIDGGADAGKLAERLLRNQDDLGNAVKPFYGEAAGNELAALLREHILVAADLVKAAKAGDAAAQEKATKEWYRNADDTAAFLSAANPHWPQKALQEMLRGHLSMTTDAVVAKLHKDTAKAIQAYDQGHEHMLMLSDALADGIVKQFASRFGA